VRDVLRTDRLLGEAPREGAAERVVAVGGEQGVQAIDVADPDTRPPMRELGEVLQGGTAQSEQVLAL
jgi:hypothetical protein